MVMTEHVVLPTRGKKYLDKKSYKANKAFDLIHLTFSQKVWEWSASDGRRYLESWEVISR